MRELSLWRFSLVPARSLSNEIKQLVAQQCDGLNKQDALFVDGFLSRVDTGYLGGDMKKIQAAFQSIVKTMKFLGFFDDSQKLTTENKKGKRPSLDVLGDVMADKLKLDSHDRDLVVMQHRFILED